MTCIIFIINSDSDRDFIVAYRLSTSCQNKSIYTTYRSDNSLEKKLYTKHLRGITMKYHVYIYVQFSYIYYI